jgi:uncharacterized protein (TIGR03086 family)
VGRRASSTLRGVSQETIDRITTLVNEFDRRVKAAGSDQWSKPAPCEGWTARDVVAHVTNNLRYVVAGIRGEQPQEVGPDDDIAAAWASAKDNLMAALPGADLSQTVNGPLGPMPAEQFIGRIISTDVLVHTWDLARATGGDEKLNQQAIEGAYSGLKPLDAMIRRPGVFGPKIEPAPGADLQTEFLNFTGRNV